MDNIINIIKTDKDSIDFNVVKIGMISPEDIISRSFGEIKKPETINYRTFKAERDGLFCAKIFGPTKDYECLCGKYKKLKHRGVICEKCGVEVTTAKIRRSRMGHVVLTTPVAHIWFLKSLPSKFGLILNMPLKNIEKVLYFEQYIMIDNGSSGLKRNQLINEREYNRIFDDKNLKFTAKTGGAALVDLLKKLDLAADFRKVRSQIKTTLSENRGKYLSKKLQLIEHFIKSGNKPEWMMIINLPILPPDLRPLVALDGGKFASSDINDLYRRIISRNNRVKKLFDLSAPAVIIKNEKRMLQEAVDALIDNDKKSRPITSSNKRPLKSIADILKGKQGRFRLNLLGKRVDYSGRTVIVVGPSLKLHQCGIPKIMALELFKPFVFGELKRRNISNTIKRSKKMLDNPTPEIFEILSEIIHQYPVLLNRAPTLHRLSIQAFEPLLIEGKAIQLHPLVCTAFNADFDGDQMAVHIPLTIESQMEARILMMSTNNLLSPANGEPIIVPSQDMVLGIYYMSKVKNLSEDKIEYFKSERHLYYRYENNTLDLHTPIYYKNQNTYIKTTYGRLLLKKILPENLDFKLVNKIMTKKEISNLISESYKKTGLLTTIHLVEKLMDIGFCYSTKSGISIGMDDLVIPDEKVAIIKDAEETIMKLEEDYFYGLIHEDDRYNTVLELWSNITEAITKEVVKKLKSTRTVTRTGEIHEDSFNTMFMITESGARGSIAQIRQLVGIRGLMTKPNGYIVETPILASFKEGLSILQYFISTHGARKGLADTALKTANSGYLTRRLVDVAQDLVITIEDCYTDNYLLMDTVPENATIIEPLRDRIEGRIIQENIYNEHGEQIVEKGNILTEYDLDLIDELELAKLKIRSVIMCEAESGVCARCYGTDLSTGRLITVGEAVGIIAAQSIGEPGTQLTMRTFHMGGIASKFTARNFIQTGLNGIMELKGSKLVKYGNSEHFIVISKSTTLTITSFTKKEKEHYKVPYGSIIKKLHATEVKCGDVIAQWDPHNFLIISEIEGCAKFLNIIDRVTVKNEIDEVTGFIISTVTDFEKKFHFSNSIKPSIKILNNQQSINYYLSPGTVINIVDEQMIKPGDIIAKIPRDALLIRNTDGGLPKVADIFEARKPKDPAILATESGMVKFTQDHKGKKRLFILDKNNIAKEIILQGVKIPSVFENEIVKRGDLIAEGEHSLHNVLDLLGVNVVVEKIKNEIQEIYRTQGVKIDDRHIEIIIKQMLKKALVLDPGDSELLPHVYENVNLLKKKNNVLKSKNKKEIVYKQVLLGISKASLISDSFLSSASFQETTRILTDAAICRKKDKLLGLKENVITGKLIPAGTGFYKKID